jgi:hypothetical protein
MKQLHHHELTEKPAAEINPGTWVVLLQCMKYSRLLGRCLSRLIALAAKDFEVPVCCTRHVTDFCP